MQKLVRKFLTNADLQKVKEDTAVLAEIVKPCATSVNNKQKIGIRTMAEGREGYVRTASRIALTYTECLPRQEDPEELQEGLDYFDRMMKTRTVIAYLLEMMDDTAVALGVDLMGIADRYVGYLQQARAGNTSLDVAMGEIDAYNKRFGIRLAERKKKKGSGPPAKE